MYTWTRSERCSLPGELGDAENARFCGMKGKMRAPELKCDYLQTTQRERERESGGNSVVKESSKKKMITKGKEQKA